MRKPKKLVNLTLTVAASLTLLTGCGAPNTCDTNHSFQETRIEVRNYQAGHYQQNYGMRPCLNADGSMNMCPYDDTIWVQGHFEWREQGKYGNPDEGWVQENEDLKESDTGYSYKKTSDWDQSVCDGRDEHSSRNGEVTGHTHLEELYIQK